MLGHSRRIAAEATRRIRPPRCTAQLRRSKSQYRFDSAEVFHRRRAMPCAFAGGLYLGPFELPQREAGRASAKVKREPRYFRRRSFQRFLEGIPPNRAQTMGVRPDWHEHCFSLRQ